MRVDLGFGGAFLVLGQVNQFQPNVVNGRGFIAIAAVIFGGWTLRGTVLGCILFGFVEALTIAIPCRATRSTCSSSTPRPTSSPSP